MLALSCHSWAYSDRPLEEALGTIARLGFQNVDLGSGLHVDIEAAVKQPAGEAERLRDLLRYYNLRLTDLYILLPDINAPDPAIREGQLELFRDMLPFAQALGTPGITVSPGTLQPDGAEHSLARTVPALLAMSQAMETLDMRLSFEPQVASAVTTPQQALLLVETVPGLSLTLDYAHFIVQGFKLDSLTPLLPFTAHIHLRQAAKGRLQTSGQQGKLDIAAVLESLIAADYRGVIALEYLTSAGVHGAVGVNISQETVALRDEIRRLRGKRR